MNHYSSGARNTVYALITATFAWLLSPSNGALAQDNAAPAASAASAAPTEAANQSRRDRRRAETAAAQATAAPAPAASAAPTAAAAPAAAAVPAAAATAASDGPATICKNIKPLGTRMAKRVCGTPEQWAALEKKTTESGSDDLRQVRSTGGVIATTPGPTAAP